MAASDAAARQVKDQYGEHWRAQGWHTISVRADQRGAYLWIGVDPEQPLPPPHSVDDVPLVFEHVARFRLQGM
jgi:hypothetical protein